MDPLIISDYINRDEINSCSSGLSDSVDSSLTIVSRDYQVFIPQDKVLKLINAIKSEPKAFSKPQNKSQV